VKVVNLQRHQMSGVIVVKTCVKSTYHDKPSLMKAVDRVYKPYRVRRNFRAL